MEFVIGNPKVNNNPKNCYQIKLDHMHGDADATTHTKHTFKDTTTGVVSLQTLVKVIKLSEKIDCDFFYSTKIRKNAMREAGFSDEVINTITDFFEHDCTNDGNTYAIIEGYEIVYFDENGVQHEVEVKE